MVDPAAHIPITDSTLFGNEGAEDERPELFLSYVVERPELDIFVADDVRLAVVRAYKGEGKSALLRLARERVEQRDSHAVILAKTADELAPDLERSEYGPWVRAWKKSILEAFAMNIGSRIGFAWTDDAMALVEESERLGFRSRSFLSAVLDRIKLPNAAESAIPRRVVTGAANAGEALKRQLGVNDELWLFVDDVDKNFANTPAAKMRVASFFDACRSLTNEVPQLRVRTAVRPNVWTIAKLEFESLSHLRQYVHDLSWNVNEARALLSKRIEAFLTRRGEWGPVSARFSSDVEAREEQTIALVFDAPMRWGWRRNPHSVLHTLAKHRPRWMIELAKLAARRAARRRRHKINADDISAELLEFGHRRIEDTVAEFRPQCAELHECITAFANEREKFSTLELLATIEQKILSTFRPKIAGLQSSPTARDVAALLYEVGLFYARRDFPDRTYEHIGFSDDPGLLRPRAASTNDMVWEIHPAYRQALHIRDERGRKTARRLDE